MPSRKSRPSSSSSPRSADNLGTPLGSVSGASTAPIPDPQAAPSGQPRALVAKFVSTGALSGARPWNADKPGEHGDASRVPEQGSTVELADAATTGSTVSETTTSDKVGSGRPPVGVNATIGTLDRVRADGSGQPLTTNQGVRIADNQNSLKIGLRGPTALEDFILREKITHFDHERIPERIVHARGSAAHGFFECTNDITAYSKAAPFAKVGKQTPVFVRFSTVAGERGSADTVRDVRGFAVKFYTDEGNWDLVGNNMPVFFIQDAMKFPDLVHAVKPEPHHAMPQASSAHDTFWDFVSLMPESTHMLTWLMSDRAIPRSYRTMQGFGVHTFRLVNADGASVFCKFHWTPAAGTHSLVWDEAAKICGADADFHRRDLWEAIEGGAFPEWQLAVQIFTEDEAEGFGFDVLDATKIVPEELVPLTPVGRMVLNRNPDNFFAETEQVAFCTAHIVPGIDFTNDPLLQGRIHSYLDTQISRLGGPNFHEIAVNSPIVPVANNQREGMHRQAIHRWRVTYEPNSLCGGCPFQAGLNGGGFTSFPDRMSEPDKVRGKPELFADHYSQATLFFSSQTPVEQAHIIAAFRFELSRVQTQAIRERVVSMLVNVDTALATGVANGLGIDLPPAMPKVLDKDEPQYLVSPALSLMSRPGDGSLKAMKIAFLVAPGVELGSLQPLYAALVERGAVPRYVGPHLGAWQAASGEAVHVDTSLEAMPAVLFDGLVVPDGSDAIGALGRLGQALDFVKEQYRHCKPILAIGAGAGLLEKAGVAENLPGGDPDPGVIVAEPGNKAAAFLEALARRRHYERETDPPAI